MSPTNDIMMKSAIVSGWRDNRFKMSLTKNTSGFRSSVRIQMNLEELYILVGLLSPPRDEQCECHMVRPLGFYNNFGVKTMLGHVA
jgi:hypothetical protein